MPNHITNKLLFTGVKEDIQKMIDRFSTFVPRTISLAASGEIICRNTKSDEFSVGWYCKKTDIFKSRNYPDVKGLPEGWKYEYNEEFLHFPDFEKIVPKPEILNKVVSGSSFINGRRVDNPIREVIKEEDFDESFMTKSPWPTSKVEDGCIEIEREATIQERREIQRTGYVSWYEWCCDNWGTKWNSYSCEKVEENIYTFQTAWSGVTDLILEMSKAFPNVTIDYKYADEDTGYNVGHYNIFRGEILEDNSPEKGSKEAYELAFELMPSHKEYYKLIDGNYEYYEED